MPPLLARLLGPLVTLAARAAHALQPPAANADVDMYVFHVQGDLMAAVRRASARLEVDPVVFCNAAVDLAAQMVETDRRVVLVVKDGTGVPREVEIEDWMLRHTRQSLQITRL